MLWGRVFLWFRKMQFLRIASQLLVLVPRLALPSLVGRMWLMPCMESHFGMAFSGLTVAIPALRCHWNGNFANLVVELKPVLDKGRKFYLSTLIQAFPPEDFFHLFVFKGKFLNLKARSGLDYLVLKYEINAQGKENVMDFLKYLTFPDPYFPCIAFSKIPFIWDSSSPKWMYLKKISVHH